MKLLKHTLPSLLLAALVITLIAVNHDENASAQADAAKAAPKAADAPEKEKELGPPPNDYVKKYREVKDEAKALQEKIMAAQNEFGELVKKKQEKYSPEVKKLTEARDKTQAELEKKAAALRTEFEAAEKEFQEAMTIIQDKFKADLEDLKDDREKVESVMSQMDGIGDKIQAAALAVCVNAPKTATDEMKQMVLAGIMMAMQADSYEKVVAQADKMIAGKYTPKEIFDPAIVAAINICQFDKAKAFEKAAKENGVSLQEATVAQLKDLQQLEKDWKAELAIREKEAKDTKNPLPRVLLSTDAGDVMIELFENEAPNTVANFISLVEKGYYDGLNFHRVLPGFMAQGGCPEGTGTGGPGYHIACETGDKFPNARKHFRGTLSMAHAGPDTGGSQFFLTFVPTSFLDGRHTAFGRVVEGEENLGKIMKRDPSNPQARMMPATKIKKATVVSKRKHDYTPKTIKVEEKMPVMPTP